VSKIWAPWLMTLFLTLQFAAVATDAHQLSPVGDEAPGVVEVESDCFHASCPDAGDANVSDSGFGSDHCPHCCHCNWHAVASVPFFGGQRVSSTAPPYHVSFRSHSSSSFFRPPKHG
jgi:hypothetical protein